MSTTGSRGRRLRRRATGPLLAVVLVATAGCTDVSSGSEPAPSSTPATESTSVTTEAPRPQVATVEIDLQANIDAATAFAAGQGLEVSIAVIDRVARQEFVNGAAADEPIWGASLVKLFLADNLLHRQRAGEFRLSAPDLELLNAMIVSSNDTAADELYTRFGGAAMVTEVAQRYQLSSVAPTNQPGFWELTTMSARDVARYYDRFLTEAPAMDLDYLLQLLRRTVEVAADGFDQRFGLPAALPGQTLAIKQGWMCCPRETSYLHTTGVLGSDNRYAVAILSQNPGVFSTAYATDLLGQVAAMVFPPGSIDN